MMFTEGKDEIKGNKRAVRRHHRERLKRKRGNYGNVFTEKQLLKAIDTPHPCSCALCGNPRRYGGDKTPAEQKSEDNFRQEFKDLDQKIAC